MPNRTAPGGGVACRCMNSSTAWQAWRMLVADICGIIHVLDRGQTGAVGHDSGIVHQQLVGRPRSPPDHDPALAHLSVNGQNHVRQLHRPNAIAGLASWYGISPLTQAVQFHRLGRYGLPIRRRRRCRAAALSDRWTCRQQRQQGTASCRR